MYPQHYHHAVILQFCYFTGMRISSVMALTWDDLDFERELITFTKSLKHRTKELVVPFSDDPEFKELIQKLLLWVQRVQKDHGVRGFNYEIMKRHCQELGIPYGNHKDALWTGATTTSVWTTCGRHSAGGSSGARSSAREEIVGTIVNTKTLD